MRSTLLLVVSVALWVRPSASSYFQVPRIHFSGMFRADSATGNNDRENYDCSEELNPSWNVNGTNEFWLTDCTVTSVVLEYGSPVTDGGQDSAIGRPIVNNINSPSAKLADLDSTQWDLTSTLYGMEMGLEGSLYGQWVPTSISRDFWFRQINDTSADRYTQTIGTQGSSRLRSVVWGALESSSALQQLKDLADATDSKELSVSLTLFKYHRSHQDDLYTYGWLMGTIGVAGDAEEPLNFVGQRVLKRVRQKDPPWDPSLSPGCQSAGGEVNPTTCAGSTEWLYAAYFSVHKAPDTDTHYATIDFGNSVQLKFDGSVCDFGTLYLGYIAASTEEPTQIAEIHYKILTTSGVFDIELPSGFTGEDSEFVVYTTLHHEAVCSADAQEGCGDTQPYIILREKPVTVWPMDDHFYRLQADSDMSSATVEMQVRRFGQPLSGCKVELRNESPEKSDPTVGLDFEYDAESDNKGIATFTFKAKEIGHPWVRYGVDGIVYAFAYCAVSCGGFAETLCEEGYTNMLAIKVWGRTEYQEPVFWDEHVQPIFSQYERLYPAMSHILRLGDYDDVTKQGNIQVLLKAMGLPFEHPSYMPVTRDLSPSRKNMILDWLKSENHYRNWADVQEKAFTAPDFCGDNFYPGKEKYHPPETLATEGLDEYGAQLEHHESSLDRTFAKHMLLAKPSPEIINMRMQLRESKAPSPFAWLDEAMLDQCNLPRDLQSALQLEFATIPLYLTSLYSIKPGHNQEVYGLIRSVVMQEMLHMAQVANILIAMGHRPIIDSEAVVPSFPGSLPGGVLPGLTVELKRASPKHVYDVFMMVEFPADNLDMFPEVGDQVTIGKFYQHIKKCIRRQEDESFQKNDDLKVKWPWDMLDPTSHLYEVTDVASAVNAVNMIIDQGEGSGRKNPYYHYNALSHYYKFGEVACKHRINTQMETYSFDGEPIEFTPEGVWPMRDNPSSESIPKGSQAYHRAKLFHRVYRALLTKLQEVFGGNSDAIDDAVYLMESMQLHAKVLMQLQVPGEPGRPEETYGPVFQYTWKDSDQN